MKKILTKKPLLLITSVLLIIAGIVLLYLPILLPAQAKLENQEQLQGVSILFKDKYNPINPKAAMFFELYDEDAFLVSVTRLHRIGLFKFRQANNDFSGFEQFTDKIYAKSIQEAKEMYIGNYSQGYLDAQQRYEEYRAEIDKPIECRRLVEFENKGREVEDFSGLKQNMNYIEYGEFFRENIGDSSLSYSVEFYNMDYRIDSGIYKNIAKLSLVWTKSPSSVDFEEEELKQVTLIGLNIITQTCQIIPVPTNPDGTFDFESALKEVKD